MNKRQVKKWLFGTKIWRRKRNRRINETRDPSKWLRITIYRNKPLIREITQHIDMTVDPATFSEIIRFRRGW